MSHDLFFSAGRGKRLDRKAFTGYFKTRRWYDVKNGQAVYQNEDTGVYFIFDEPVDELVAFNLNYYRPHTFGLEAAVELEAFSAAFDATVADADGNEGPFDKRQFLHSWNHGNRFGYQAMVKEADEPIHTWPSARIRETWLWNYTRPSEEQMDSDGIFTPAIFAIDHGGKAMSVAIWPPECTIVLPAVDAVLVPLAQSGKQSEKLALVLWPEVLPIVEPYHERAKGLARYRLAMEQWPPPILEFLTRKRKPVGDLKGIAMDELLDRELVEEARRG